MRHRQLARAASVIAIAIAALASSAPVRAQEHQHAAPAVGSVHFPVACNAAAQERMHAAVAMLHSFWFPEARRALEGIAFGSIHGIRVEIGQIAVERLAPRGQAHLVWIQRAGTHAHAAGRERHQCGGMKLTDTRIDGSTGTTRLGFRALRASTAHASRIGAATKRKDWRSPTI